jgi:hypothetical protein
MPDFMHRIYQIVRAAAPTSPMSQWVNIDKTQPEHNTSGCPPIADIGADLADGSFVPTGDVEVDGVQAPGSWKSISG